MVLVRQILDILGVLHPIGGGPWGPHSGAGLVVVSVLELGVRGGELHSSFVHA